MYDAKILMNLFMQDVIDNHEEAAGAAPQALRLCQMVIKLSILVQVDFDFECSILSADMLQEKFVAQCAKQLKLSKSPSSAESSE